MLSYEKCIELRDNGFPQPDLEKMQSGDFWALVDGKPVFINLVLTVTDTGWPENFVFQKPEKGMCSIVAAWRTSIQAYHPTVEDMLSLIDPSYSIAKTRDGNWIFFEIHTKAILYLEKTPLEVLYEAWIDRRYLFEDNGRQD